MSTEQDSINTIDQDTLGSRNQDIASVSEQNMPFNPAQPDTGIVQPDNDPAQPDIQPHAGPMQAESHPQPDIYAESNHQITAPASVAHSNTELTTPVLSSPAKTQPHSTRQLASIVALIIILGSIGFYALTTYQNVQRGYATATAQRADKNATGTVMGNLATATGAVRATSAAYSYATATVATQQMATEAALANVRATMLPPLKQSPYPPYTGNLTVYDFLNVDHQELPNQGGCVFKDDGYHITVAGKYYLPCPEGGSYGDFAMDVQLTINQGDCGGLIFRADIAARNYYFFEICADGTYMEYRYHGKGTYDYDPLKSGNSSAIQTGTGVNNVIAVVAIGHNLDFYVNHQAVDHETDDVYIQGGSIALVSSGLNLGTEVTFVKERLWTF